MQLSIVTIGAFVAVLNEGTKYIANNFIKKDVSKFIPICSVLYGIILGIIGFYLPDGNMGSNLVEAIFIGISAGSASTGIHQIGKQLTKTETTSNESIEVVSGETVIEEVSENDTSDTEET